MRIGDVMFPSLGSRPLEEATEVLPNPRPDPVRAALGRLVRYRVWLLLFGVLGTAVLLSHPSVSAGPCRCGDCLNLLHTIYGLPILGGLCAVEFARSRRLDPAVWRPARVFSFWLVLLLASTASLAWWASEVLRIEQAGVDSIGLWVSAAALLGYAVLLQGITPLVLALALRARSRAEDEGTRDAKSCVGREG